MVRVRSAADRRWFEHRCLVRYVQAALVPTYSPVVDRLLTLRRLPFYHMLRERSAVAEAAQVAATPSLNPLWPTPLTATTIPALVCDEVPRSGQSAGIFHLSGVGIACDPLAAR